ncbi:hypothetical protein M405DRAFT_638963 [Rhizopogon salebrosus TDB-379]|nr:hypothetical protein M405DRAFT_638963 [Rhizopogon salebrosus TDB-379]
MAFTTDVPLDPSLYRLDPTSLEFFKQQTGIAGEDDLKRHIFGVQAQAFAVAPYPCIYSFGFTKLRISKHPKYQNVLQLGRDCTGALLLDLGCCFGNDARKAVADGWPVTQIISTDIKQEFWDLGHDLFRSTSESFPSTFIAGDCLEPSFLTSDPGPASPSPVPDLSSITSLNDLHGTLTAIHASSIFHLFSAEEQASLIGLPRQGTVGEEVLGMSVEMYCYDPESWKKLWEDAGSFKVEAFLTEVIDLKGEVAWKMFWSATKSMGSAV